MRDEILGQLREAMPLERVVMGSTALSWRRATTMRGRRPRGNSRDSSAPTALIGCEYDPHCHLTEKRVRLANVSILFKEYPHVDVMDRGEELVTLVLRTIRGEIRPVSSLYDPRMWDFYPTTTEPMRSFVDRAKALEGRDGVLSVSIAHGFMHADVEDMGSRVLVVTDDRKAEGDRLAERLGRELWEGRGGWSPPALPLADGVSKVLEHDEGLAILAEPADNAGGGAASDNTLVIHELRRRKAFGVAVAPVWDPQAVAFCHMAGLGARIPLRFGGKASEGSGPPVDAAARVIGLARDAWQSFGDARVPLGDTAAIRIDENEDGDGIDVVLIESRTQALGTELFTALGLDPSSYEALVLKSAQHFAGAFGPLASLVLRAETGGACPTQPRMHPYSRVRRPLWPLDDEVEGRLLL